MALTVTWTPDPTLLTNLAKIASQQGKTIELVLSEAVQEFLESQPIEQNTSHSNATENSVDREENTSQFLLQLANSFAKGLTDEELTVLPNDSAEHHDRYLRNNQ